MDTNSLLSDNSYQKVIAKIKKKIQLTKADTIAGTSLPTDVYSKLNESKTPMMEVKDFITKAESVASDDTSLKDVVDFCKKAAVNNDLNYIINMCKEEHMVNLSRSGHPKPEETLKDIKDAFDEPSSVIEAGIKAGLFDKLNSKLLNDVKTALNVKVADRGDVDKALNEAYQYGLGGFCKYTPIGLAYEDKEQNRFVVLTESDVLSYDQGNKAFKKINDANLPSNLMRLNEALQSCSFDPETGCFSLCENWDFHMVLAPDGKTFVSKDGKAENMREIPHERIQQLLLESINTYLAAPGKIENFNKDNFIKDADNFVMLAENANLLYKLDELRVIRNLNENSYCLLELNTIKTENTPRVLSLNGKESKLYESFIDLCEGIKNTISFDCKPLFESEIKSEYDQLNSRQEALANLNEEQNKINENIGKVKRAMSIAEADSPAMRKLMEQNNQLEAALSKNIEQVKFYQTEFKLH